MGAVAWGAVAVAMALGLIALALLRWRSPVPDPLRDAVEELVLDLAAAEDEAREWDLAFDAIVGNLLLSDPGFADSAPRLSRQDDTDAPS